MDYRLLIWWQSHYAVMCGTLAMTMVTKSSMKFFFSIE